MSSAANDTVQSLLRGRLGDDGIAVKYDDRKWSWREHLSAASSVAAALLAVLDRMRPPHIGLLLANSPQMVVQLAAAGLGGYVVCGINTTRRGSALLADIRRADCQILITDAAHRHLLTGADLTGIRLFDTSTAEWQQLVAGGLPLVPYREVTALDTFMMIFTSGTGGNPKAVRVSHFMVAMSGRALTDQFSLSPADTCYVSMPLFHSNAIVAGWSVAINSGAAMAPARFSASHFLTDIRRYSATYMNYVGKPLAYILDTPARPDDADNPLRVAFGNEAGDHDIDEFGRRFDVEVVDGFGSTENAVIVTREPGTPTGSIGRGFPGVAVYNSETITECAAATFDSTGALNNADQAVGELVNTAGTGFFTGYYNDEHATAERLRHGIYWSGDLAYRDADGWIYLAGRTADWMRVDGENIAAAPIERILIRCSAVSRVAVYAVRGADGFDQVVAALDLRTDATLTPAEFAAFLSAQPDLSPTSWPRYVRLTHDFPVTATHKVVKRELIAQGVSPGSGVLWVREPRGTTYSPSRTGSN
ncbi:MAG TPA: fatty-acid--CoA ligase FadD1 [Mycobacterium sp.]|nr:fatty-acid--CoA ligase FadD1 [Mycobacterium sp.]